MIETNSTRKAQSRERIFYRSANHTLKNVIVKGTNCSSFEADIITEKAQEILQIGQYTPENTLQPGQMIWKAIDEKEPPGKPLRECIFKTIRLTVHELEEDQEILQHYTRSAKRGQQILRMTQEALDQGALLTQEDLAVILDSDVKTIRMDIKRLQEKQGLLVPTRGTRKDIGPGITHRDKVIALYLQGRDPVSISRDLKHSLKAVERYINTFCRIFYTFGELHETLKVALVVGVSVRLVNRCLDLAEKYRGKEFFEERLSEIESVGRIFWEAQDAKKNRGRKRRRQG